MKMVTTYCENCNKVTGEMNAWDFKFASNFKCWECIFNECENCYGQGITGWVSAEGDFDFDYCECNPLRLTLDEVRNV